MNTDMIIAEGFASGINQGIKGIDESTISHYVLPIVFRELSIGKWVEVWSTRIRSRRIMRKFVRKNCPKGERENKNLLIFCKSMGVVETYDLLDRVFDEIKCYNTVGIMSIDGHSKLFKDLFKKPYGMRREFFFLREWHKHSIVVQNYYQHNKWPHGAYFRGANLNIEITDEDVDHFSIIRHPLVIDGIYNICEVMKKRGSSYAIYH